MKKQNSESDIMIDVLEEAARRSHSDEPFEWKEYGPAELAIIIDLIDEKKVRGEIGEGNESQIIALSGITLSGRQLRDELIAKRDEKKFTSRLKKAVWAALGSIGTLVFEYVKKKIGSN